MKRRAIPLFLLLVGACTGVRPAPTFPAPSSTSTGAASPPARLTTSMDMEVGPSEYVGSSANSPGFTVEEGERFTVTFDARVAPSSVGSGYFSLVFQDGSREIGRERIAFAPASFALGTRTTDENGTFRATFHPPGVELALGRVKVEARFDGDDRFLPASASGTIFVH